jgi:hypothetical protein
MEKHKIFNPILEGADAFRCQDSHHGIGYLPKNAPRAGHAKGHVVVNVEKVVPLNDKVGLLCRDDGATPEG